MSILSISELRKELNKTSPKDSDKFDHLWATAWSRIFSRTFTYSPEEDVEEPRTEKYGPLWDDIYLALGEEIDKGT